MAQPGTAPDPFRGVIGPRRRLGIGITPEQFRRDALPLPPETEVSKYSENPRNRYGDWYEAIVAAELERICSRRGWHFELKRNIGWSAVYRTNKVVDVLVNGALGLELKFLKGSGSLVGPKAMIDAIDFTSRSIYCMYVVDGPGWLIGQNVEYLHHWWDFTCFKHLEETVQRFTDLPANIRKPLRK